MTNKEQPEPKGKLILKDIDVSGFRDTGIKIVGDAQLEASDIRIRGGRIGLDIGGDSEKTAQDSNDDRNRRRWYYNPYVVGIAVTVLGGMIVTAILFLFT